MSVRLEVAWPVDAPAERVWAELTDWAGQRRWIPFTTVEVAGPQTGLGVRAEAVSGFRLGRAPIGLLDRFMVTGWTPPGTEPGELEVLHLGPYFTGVGVFRVTPLDGRCSLTAIEVFDLPGGAPAEFLARLALPLMRTAFTRSLRGLARLSRSTGRE